MKPFYFSIAVASLFLAGEAPAQEVVLKIPLKEAIARARMVAPRLKQFGWLQEAAEAGTRSARAGHWPSVNVSAGYTRNSDVPDLSITTPGGQQLVVFPNLPNNYRTRAEASLPLFTGGRVSSSVDSARNAERAAVEDFRNGYADLVLETTRAYWGLATALENEQVLKEALAAYEAHLKDAQNRQRVGMAAKNEVLQVQVERDQAELIWIRAQNARQVSTANLLRLLDYDDDIRVEPTDPLESPRPPLPSQETLVNRALERRPDRAALKARVDAAEALIGLQKASFWPQVNAVGGYDYSRPNKKILPMKDDWDVTWDVGLNLTMNLFEGGRSAANVDQARAQARALRAQLDDADEKIRLDVISRLRDLESAEAAVPVTTRSIEAAKENVSVAKNRYHAGVIPSSELLDAETSLLSVGLARADVLARVHTAQAELARAAGD
jgi:outer membrane protein TolC